MLAHRLDSFGAVVATAEQWKWSGQLPQGSSFATLPSNNFHGGMCWATAAGLQQQAQE